MASRLIPDRAVAGAGGGHGGPLTPRVSQTNPLPSLAPHPTLVGPTPRSVRVPSTHRRTSTLSYLTAITHTGLYLRAVLLWVNVLRAK